MEKTVTGIGVDPRKCVHEDLDESGERAICNICNAILLPLTDGVNITDPEDIEDVDDVEVKVDHASS